MWYNKKGQADRQGELPHRNLTGQTCEHHKALLKEKRWSFKPGIGLCVSTFDRDFLQHIS